MHYGTIIVLGTQGYFFKSTCYQLLLPYMAGYAKRSLIHCITESAWKNAYRVDIVTMATQQLVGDRLVY